DLIAQLSQQIKTLKQVQLYQAKEEAEVFVTLIRDRTGLLNPDLSRGNFPDPSSDRY
ncbi:MAG: hypothetical protein F6J98_31450, partial [Moorea sp. SIO4G2]|nr:hypothetical protein [Moorena sp. SIO4G2]